MTKNRRIIPSAAPEPASPLTEAPRRKRKNWRSWLTIQVESERYQPPRSGILLLQVLVGIFFFVFVTRFWYLQLHLGPEMTTQAQKNRLRTERIFAPRGRIFDDHGNILADNRTAYGLAIIREDCPDIPATLAQISQWTDTPLEQLQNRYNQDRFKTKPFEALPLVSGLDFGQVARIEAELVNWPGLEIMVRTNRYYPEKDLFAHVLGYVAEANSAEMEKDPDLAMGDLVGKAGLELELEKRLRAGAFEPVANEPAEPEEEVATYDLVRVKKFPVKPMHVDDAIAQMELLGHTFFLFLNEETDSMCVLYLRSDGSYGLLQPE